MIILLLLDTTTTTSTMYALKEEKIEKLSPNRDDTNLDV